MEPTTARPHGAARSRHGQVFSGPERQHAHPQCADAVETCERHHQPVADQLRRQLQVPDDRQRGPRLPGLRPPLPNELRVVPPRPAAAAHHLPPQHPRRGDPGQGRHPPWWRGRGGEGVREPPGGVCVLQRTDSVAGGSGGAPVQVWGTGGAGQDQCPPLSAFSNVAWVPTLLPR